MEPHYNGHLGAKFSWLLYGGGLFTEWHSKSSSICTMPSTPAEPPPSCLGRSLPLSWQRYATPRIGWIESWLTSRRTFSKHRTKRQQKPSTVCGTTSHTIIKRRNTRSKHASTRRWRKASKRLRTPSLPSRTRRRSSAPESLWKKMRGFWLIGKSL